jgi:hypothetical protein
MAKDTNSIPDFTSRREFATADEAFARIKNQLGDPDLSAAKLFEEMRDDRLGFGCIFRKLGPNRLSIKDTSAVLTPKFLAKQGFNGFLISDDGMHVQLWPMPSVWDAYRIFLFIKRADLDRHYPTDASVMDIRIVDVHDTLINRLSKRFDWLREVLASLTPSSRREKKEFGPQGERFWPAMKAVYPKGGYELISTPEIARQVNNWLKDEALKRGIPLAKLPKKISVPTVGRLLDRRK